jgi:hypothetical protein
MCMYLCLSICNCMHRMCACVRAVSVSVFVCVYVRVAVHLPARMRVCVDISDAQRSARLLEKPIKRLGGGHVMVTEIRNCMSCLPGPSVFNTSPFKKAHRQNVSRLNPRPIVECPGNPMHKTTSQSIIYHLEAHRQNVSRLNPRPIVECPGNPMHKTTSQSIIYRLDQEKDKHNKDRVRFHARTLQFNG